WGMEEAYDKVPGGVAPGAGYMGGETRNPTYEQEPSGRTGHAEVVRVEHDPAKVSYGRLLETLWRSIDPTQKAAQFSDHRSRNRSAIFDNDEEQRRLAEASRAALAKSKPFKGEIVTQVVKADAFYPAEESHQDYHQKNPARYKFYKTGCGR